MKFSDKIDKILKHNTLGITSVNQLEIYAKLGTGSIAKHLSVGTEPGMKVIRKLKENLRIMDPWWESGDGNIFSGSPVVEEPELELYRNNSQKEIFYLKELNKLLTESIKEKNETIQILRDDVSFLRQEIERLNGEQDTTSKRSFKEK